MTAARKPRPSAVSASCTSGPLPLAAAQRGRDDREVLRADDHGPDHQDLRVGQDAYGRDEPGQDQQDVEARRIGGVSADCALHHGPDRDPLPWAYRRICVAFRGPSRATSTWLTMTDPRALRSESAQLPQHRVGRLVGQVEVQRIAVRVAGRAREHHQVAHAWLARPARSPAGASLLRAYHAHVQHAASLGFPGFPPYPARPPGQPHVTAAGPPRAAALRLSAEGRREVGGELPEGTRRAAE